MLRRVAACCGVYEVVAHERRRERQERAADVAELEGEIRELKDLLRDTLARLEASDTKAKNLAADLEAERRDRGAVQIEVAELRGRVSGVLRDYVVG